MELNEKIFETLHLSRPCGRGMNCKLNDASVFLANFSVAFKHVSNERLAIEEVGMSEEVNGVLQQISILNDGEIPEFLQSLPVIEKCLKHILQVCFCIY